MKNQKKTPAPANLIRLDLVWVLANLVDPDAPGKGLMLLTDAWHNDFKNEEDFLDGHINRATLKSMLINMRVQIESCTDAESRTDENKFKQIIGVLNGLFQNEKVYNDRQHRLQLIQLRNHLPYYLGLCDNYVAEWNASLPSTVEISVKKELLMPNLVSYPTRRRVVAAVLFSKELLDTTKAELLYALASNDMLVLDELLGWTQNFKPYEQYKNIQEQLTKSWDVAVEIEDDNILALGRLMAEAHNLAHAPGMDGNPNLAKFLEIYEGYLGISQRMHDEFYKTNKESQMKPSKLHLIDAAVSCSASQHYPLQAINQFIVELCTDDIRDDILTYLTKKGVRPDYANSFADRLRTVVALGNDDTYRQNAIRLIGKHLQHPEQRNIQKVFGCCDAEKVLAAITKTNTLSAAELATLTTAPALQVTLGSLGLGTVQEPASYFRPADDVSHERYPFVGANPSLLETLVSVFTADPGRGLRTLLELSVAKVIMKLTDEQLDGAFTYLFRHSTVGTRLNVPPCATDASAQDKLEHLLFWTLMLCQTPQATVTSFGQPTGPCRLTEEQIATVFAYIGSIEKREILIRIL